jgi:hypothetical protein
MPYNSEYHKQWRARNRERLREYRRRWYLKNKEKIMKRAKEWRERNPEKAKEIWSRANKKRAEEWRLRRKMVFERLGNKCFVCGLISNTKLHLHHLRGFENHPMPSIKRLKEAEEHPERFTLLCFRCHEILHRFRYFPEQKERLLSLL